MRDRELQARIIAYMRPNTSIIIAGLVCAAGAAGFTVLIGKALEIAINAMKDDHVGRLNFVCMMCVLVFLLKGLFTYGQSYFLSLASQRLTSKLREDIFAHLHSLSLSYFNTSRTGAIMSTVTNDVPVLQQSTMSLKEIITAPIILVGGFTMMIITSWRLTLAAVVLVPLMGVIIQRIGKRIRRSASAVQVGLADINNITEETVSGVRIIKSFAAENHEIERFKAENDRVLTNVMKGAQKTAQLRPTLEFIGSIGLGMVLVIGGNEIVQNNRLVEVGRAPISGLKEGGLLMMVYVLQQIARAVSDIGSIHTQRQQAFSAADRIFTEVLDQPIEIADKPGAVPMSTIKGHVRFENVSFGYPDGPPVLQNLNFEVQPGQVIALVGHSGAGKSTLVDLIPRFYDVTAGRIVIDGHDIRDVKVETLRRQIGIVPQETWLFAGTIRDNIAYGRRDATDEEVRAAAYAANASFILGMPEQFNTIIGERGVRLSGGERQRIAIARAILLNPHLLILDEATSSLDASSEALVQEALETLMQGRTTFVIAHRLSTVIGADRIIVLDRGQVVEDGPHQELLRRKGQYAELYEIQFRAEMKS
jgi:subfamily B ATP-binding cassette protein MsbA